MGTVNMMVKLGGNNVEHTTFTPRAATKHDLKILIIDEYPALDVAFSGLQYQSATFIFA